MANIVFYFSATGNSLVVARDIANKLGDTKIVSVANAIKESHIDLSYECIGFVFPVYYTNIPPIIKRFVAKLNFNQSQYIFTVITNGGVTGTSFISMRKIIEERGGYLKAGFPIQMPGNNINLYSAWPNTLQRLLNKRAKKKTVKIAEVIKNKLSTHIRKGNILIRLLNTAFSDRMSNYEKFAKDYHAIEKCTGCGICEKICPVDNITMTNKRPIWGEYCEHCTACIQWCPTKAIEYADKTSKRRQYRHPEVKISDLMSL